MAKKSALKAKSPVVKPPSKPVAKPKAKSCSCGKH